MTTKDQVQVIEKAILDYLQYLHESEGSGDTANIVNEMRKLQINKYPEVRVEHNFDGLEVEVKFTFDK